MRRFQTKLWFVSVGAWMVPHWNLGLCHVFVRNRKIVGCHERECGQVRGTWGAGSGERDLWDCQASVKAAVKVMVPSKQGPVLVVRAAGLQPSRQSGSPPGPEEKQGEKGSHHGGGNRQ